MSKGRYIKRELLYFNLDYIKANIIFDKNNDLLKLSKNSNQIFFDYNWFQLTLIKQEKAKNIQNYFQIMFENISIAFIWLSEEEKEKNLKKSFIEMTWQGLTIFWVDLFYFIFSYFSLTFDKFKRIDICFDMKININYFYQKILLEKYKIKNEEDKENNINVFNSKKNWVETIYFGERNIKKNSYILNRIYNKIIDSKKKWKLFLYENYYKNDDEFFENVTRFESELREDLVKFYKFEDLKNLDFLFYRIVKSFYKYNTQFFHFLKKEDFKDIYKKKYTEKNSFWKKLFDKISNFNLISKKISLWNSINLQEIKNGNAKPLTLYQERVLKIKNSLENQKKYGSIFIDEKEKSRTYIMFKSYASKILSNWIEKQELINIINNL